MLNSFQILSLISFDSYKWTTIMTISHNENVMVNSTFSDLMLIDTPSELSATTIKVNHNRSELGTLIQR